MKMNTKININFKTIRVSAIIYSIYCALLPLNQVLNFTGFTINKYVGMIAALSFFLSIYLKNKLFLDKRCICLLLFAVWCLTTTLWSLNSDYTIHKMITLLSLVSLTIFGLMFKFNSREIRLIKYSMIFATAVLVLYLEPNTDISVSRATIQTAAGTADQNGLAANIVFSFLMCIDESIHSERKFEKILFSSISAMIFVELLLIASRGALAATFLSLIIYIYQHVSKVGSKVNLFSLLKIIVISIGILVLINYILNNVELPALDRLSMKAIQEDGGSGRFFIWENIVEALLNNPFRFLFGYGFGTEGYVTQLLFGVYEGIHNVYLEYLATTGIIGFVLMLAIFYNCYMSAKSHNDYVSLALVVALMAICFPLGFFLDKGAWNIFLLTMTGLNICKEEEDISQ